MFDNLGVLFIDHVAVTTRDLHATARHYLSIPNARIIRGPGWNAVQKVYYIFINFGDQQCIEILGLPEENESPISQHVKLGGGAYHLCFCVNDIDFAISEALKIGSKLIVEPIADDAYDGRRVAFMFHPDHGLFELVDAYGDLFKGQYQTKTALTKDVTRQQGNVVKQKDIEIELRSIFEKTFKNSLPLDPKNWARDKISEWDSLQQLRLVMEIERVLLLEVDSTFVNEFNSFSQILSYIKKKS